MKIYENIDEFFCNTDPINKEFAISAVKGLYSYCEQTIPEVIFVTGPKDLREKTVSMEVKDANLERHNDIAHFTSGVGSHYEHNVIRKSIDNYDFYCKRFIPLLPSWHDFAYLKKNEHMRNREYKWDLLASNIWAESYGFIACEGVCFVLERPSKVIFNNGFHDQKNPAIVFRDGTEIFAFNGYYMDQSDIKSAKYLTFKEIHDKNKHRPSLIQLFGIEEYKNKLKDFKIETDDLENFSLVKLEGQRPEKVIISRKKINNIDGLFIERSDDYSQKESYHLPLKTSNPREINIKKFISLNILKEQECRKNFIAIEKLNIMNSLYPFGFNHIEIEYKKEGMFRVNGIKNYSILPNTIDMQMCPSWFKACMFNKQYAMYHNSEHGYMIEYNPEGSAYDRGYPRDIKVIEDENYKGKKIGRHPSFYPTFQVELDIKSDSWKGLMEKWAKWSFDMFEFRDQITY